MYETVKSRFSLRLLLSTTPPVRVRVPATFRCPLDSPGVRV